jgi:hypothetical protein
VIRAKFSPFKRATSGSSFDFLLVFRFFDQLCILCHQFFCFLQLTLQKGDIDGAITLVAAGAANVDFQTSISTIT